MVRLVLAATLGASYGIYGPAFELMEDRAREPGSEEYLDSEKYQLRTWDRDRPASLEEFIARVNRIRRDNSPLQSDRSLTFHDVDNDSLIAYSKTNEAPAPNRCSSSPMSTRTIRNPAGSPSTYAHWACQPKPPSRWTTCSPAPAILWRGARNFVSLDPQHSPAHIFRVRRRVRTERDFDYFL